MSVLVAFACDETGVAVRQNILRAGQHLAFQSNKPGGCRSLLSDVRRMLSRIVPDQTAVLTFLSRSLNLLTGGSPREIFCSRAHRNGWRVCPYIDGLFRMIRSNEKEHCRACYLGQERIRRRRQRASG